MYLNTLGNNEMYISVAEMLETDIEVVKKFIKENANEIVNCHYDERNIEQMKLDNLINGNKPKRIQYLTVNHITPRESKESIWKEGLLTLSHVLTEKTALSNYLQKLGFAFSFNEGQIIMSKNGRIVDVQYKSGTNLKIRLGGKNTFNDYNINGYLFVDEFEIDEIKGWLGSPEILKSIAIYYDKKSIANNYADKCCNYYVSFKVPLDSVDICGFSDDIDADRKTRILLKYTINALSYAEQKKKPYFSMCNPIIYLKRDYDVPKEDIIKIWDFRSENGKLIPIESKEDLK